jgi:hypothetical protein
MNQPSPDSRKMLLYLLQAVHLVGSGVWLGALIFFPFCVALPVIDGMQALAKRPDNWLHLHSEKEGIRLAGEFLDIVFARYFLFQLGCGLAALIPAMLWLRYPGKVHRFRVVLLVAAVLLVAGNQWWLAKQVHHWRHARYGPEATSTDSVSTNAARSSAENTPASGADAEQAFWFWHTLSLAADLLVLVLVLVVLLLAPFVPGVGVSSRVESAIAIQGLNASNLPLGSAADQ